MATRFVPDDYQGVARLYQPLESTLTEFAAGQAAGRPALRFAIALSGGADSAMLAVHAALVRRRFPSFELHCFHVHHGLQAIADSWREQVHQLAVGLRLPCHSLRVDVDMRSGKGVEAAAREARYRAFQQLAELTGVTHILLAHHGNDQAETVLLRLLRGAGPTGLGAMAPSMRRDGLTYLRPWLEVDRQEILSAAREYGERTGWHAVTDPTNLDDAYTRGAVRQRLVPALDERWPAWRTTLGRHARQARELESLLDEIASDDFQRLDPSNGDTEFSLNEWRALSPSRRVLVLRHWLQKHKLRAPSDARMRELCRQLAGLHALGHDRSMRLQHDGHVIACVRGRVRLLLPGNA